MKIVFESSHKLNNPVFFKEKQAFFKIVMELIKESGYDSVDMVITNTDTNILIDASFNEKDT